MDNEKLAWLYELKHGKIEERPKKIKTSWVSVDVPPLKEEGIWFVEIGDIVLMRSSNLLSAMTFLDICKGAHLRFYSVEEQEKEREERRSNYQTGFTTMPIEQKTVPKTRRKLKTRRKSRTPQKSGGSPCL
jgi:hypothetical protein